MTEYMVVWEVQVEAESPEAAARTAIAMQRNPESTATVFEVFPQVGSATTIDLDEIDEMRARAQ